MLDKFKFFNTKDKTEKVSKRTSSSSGFSSARSERSDSSNSICSEAKATICSNPTNASNHHTTSTNSGNHDTRAASPVHNTTDTASGDGNQSHSPKLAVKNFARKTFGRSIGTPTKTSSTSSKEPSSASPKSSSKKLQEPSATVKSPSVAEKAGSRKELVKPSASTVVHHEVPDVVSGHVTAGDTTNNLSAVRSSSKSTTRGADGLAAAIQPDNPIKESKIASLVSQGIARRCNSKDSLASATSSTELSSTRSHQMASTATTPASPVITSIPKPTAAVKGTTKVSKDDRRLASGQTVTSDVGVKVKSSNGSGSTKTAIKSSKTGATLCTKSDGSSQVDFTQLIAESGGGTAVVSPSSSLLRQGRSDRGRHHHDSGQSSVSIAMVSPMPSNAPGDFGTAAGELGKPPKPHFALPATKLVGGASCTTTTTTTTTRSKVETTFDNSDEVITRETKVVVPRGSSSSSSSSSSARETTFSEEPEDACVNIKPMQPLMRASPYGYVRNLGNGCGNGVGSPYSSARTLVPSLHVARLGLGSRPMFTAAGATHHSQALYGNGACQILKRTALGEGEYGSDVDSVDLTCGYMSDGDVLRPPGGRGGVGGAGTDDIASGYLSEGGASLYNRRLQCKMRENLATVREGVQKAAFVNEDGKVITSHPRFGLDDSSSVSSGLSDTIAEISTDDNYTGSSVSSEHGLPYGSLKRSPKDGTRIGHAANGVGAERNRKDEQRHHLSGSKSSHNVRKADCAQQTEHSVFKHSSSSAVKKTNNTERDHSSGRSSGDHGHDREDLLRRGRSDLDSSSGRGSSRDRRGDGSSGTSTGQQGGTPGILRKSGSSSGSDKRNSDGSPKSKRKGLPGDTKYPSSPLDGMEKSSPRSSRSGSVESQSCSSVTGSSAAGRKSQNIRTTASSLASLAYNSGKRPNSTCSVSSAGSSRSAGSSKLNGKKGYADLDGTMPAAQHLLDMMRNQQAVMMQVSGIPRPGSAQAKMESGSPGSGSHTLERNGKSSRGLTNAQTLQELYASYGNGELGDYGGHGSLGRSRRHRQYNFAGNGTSTVPTPQSKMDFVNMVAGNGQRHLHSPRLSVSSKSHHNDGMLDHHPSPYSVYSAASDGASSVHSSSASSPYASWLRRSPSTISSVASLPTPRSLGGGSSLTEAESLESLTSTSSIHAQIQHARANSLTHACLAQHQQRHHTASPSPRLARSNSIRSTKSEKMYPSMLQRSEDLDAYLVGGPMSASVHTNNARNISQPTSPTPEGQGSTRYAYPFTLMGGSQSATSSPLHGPFRASSTIPSSVGAMLSKLADNKDDDDLHGSSLSLSSIASSLYTTPEEKHSHEVRKLRRELSDAKDQVNTLTCQLSTNSPRPPAGITSLLGGATWQPPSSSCTSPGPAQDWQAHVVAAFEQSLSNMTNRFQALTQSAERKDSELNELRSTIEALRKHSVAAGLTSASFAKALESPHCIRRQQSINGNGCPENRMSRQLSTDSMSSINSLSSACSAVSHVSGNSSHRSSDTSCSSKKKKKKGWLRSSFSKAFSRSKKNQNGSVSDVEDLRHLQSDTSAPNSPLLNTPHLMNDGLIGIKTSHSSSAIYDKEEEGMAPEVVQELKKQLHEKDMVLTDIRLEALSSAHQLESLKETVNRMRSEMVNLKHDNQRLQRLVSNKSLTSSQSSLPITDNLDQRLSTSEMSATSSIDAILADATIERDSKRVTVSVFLCCHGDSHKMATAIKEAVAVSEVLIGSIAVSAKTKWDLLDSLVRRAFKEYVLRVDPVSNLGLNAESVHSYHLGEVTITKDGELPELLPCGYLIGDTMNIKLMLKGTKQNSVDSLAFETLVPKSIVHRYMSLLTEHRRIILCGPSGTGKTYLAHKLAEFLVLRSGKLPTPGSIATFNVDHKSAKELRQYLSNVAEQCEGSNAADLPSVIILDNLHHVGSLGEVFNGFLSAKYQNCPYIIGTMNQATCSTTNLQLHHNFRWVLCANHMEPVKGFLGRHLRRKLVETEAKVNLRNNDLIKVIDWMPKVWQQLNKFLETHSSSDVTIGPRLFLSCPIDISASQVWFTDLWNYSVVPYLLEAVREGLQLYGRRAPWEDPTEWVIESYPWPSTGPTAIDWPSLLRMRPEDVGYEGHPGPGGIGAKSVCSGQGDLEGDPLLNMLMRLQEAASYSSPHSNDSDTTSLDSHCSSNQTEDLPNGGGGGGSNGIESTL